MELRIGPPSKSMIKFGHLNKDPKKLESGTKICEVGLVTH